MNQDLIVFFQEIICLKKDGAYAINLDEYADVGTYWIALFCNKNNIIYSIKKLKSLLKNSLEIKT